MRKTNAAGRLTTPMSPDVAVTPRRATDQKSATISEIQRRHSVHGPGAFVDADTPSVFLMPRGPIFDKVMSNLEEVKARGNRPEKLRG